MPKKPTRRVNTMFIGNQTADLFAKLMNGML